MYRIPINIIFLRFVFAAIYLKRHKFAIFNISKFFIFERGFPPNLWSRGVETGCTEPISYKFVPSHWVNCKGPESTYLERVIIFYRLFVFPVMGLGRGGGRNSREATKVGSLSFAADWLSKTQSQYISNVCLKVPLFVPVISQRSVLTYCSTGNKQTHK